MYDWIKNEYNPVMIDVLEKLTIENDDIISNKRKVTKADVPILKQINFLLDHLHIISDFLEIDIDDINKEFIITGDDKNLKIKYVYGASTFREFVQPMADKFLFLSATIFDYEEMCNNLGIPVEEACFISLDSDFDPDNRPVIYKPIMKMNYGWDKNIEGKEGMLETIKAILKEHHDENGIIHTGNYSISTWLADNLEDCGHDIFHHNPNSGDKRNDIIDAFIKNKKPSLLLSPSVTEGLDMVDDLSRFVIFAKVPYLTLGDKWVKRRMEASNTWYLLNALKDILQGTGRIVRHHNDHGVAYILDESFDHLFKNMKHKIPKWWMSAFHRI
jgi:Rad3-related DNA helicase